MQSIQDTSFQVAIPSFKIKMMEKNVCYYEVAVSTLDGKKWVLEKRFKEFDILQKGLKRLFNNLPDLPSKSLFTISKEEKLQKRRENLEKYLKTIVSRRDIMNNEIMKTFLQLENYAPETIANPPKLLRELTFNFGVRDFKFEQSSGVLFVGLSDTNPATRMDSYITNIKLPWEKGPNVLVSVVGVVECLLLTDSAEFRFEKLWSKNFGSQVISLDWETRSSRLAVGMDSGRVDVFAVDKEMNYMKCRDVFTSQVHASRVMGLFLDNIRGFLYSIGEDKKLIVSEIESSRKLSEITIGASRLTCLNVDKETKRAFISNRGNQLYIYDLTPDPPVQLHMISLACVGSIRGLDYDPGKHFLFSACHTDGIINIHDLERPGREKYAKIIGKLEGKKKARAICWAGIRSEIYVGHKDGTITVWNGKKGRQIYVIASNLKDITSIVFLEGKNLLIVASKDKSVKVWQIPAEWRDRKLEEEEEKSAEINRATQTMLDYQRVKERAQVDSDEDDLAGWQK
eukprot:TRINITY_DN12737_c0_g1_i1.p1 TRINITY_DN12737_c0_g1~~TRINITY_DN12737_c0_g1_i1.p1  ORF type:complete len:513 (+),score=109.16 TRINITY_DN12737_c0_g1_i1:83-1621(+)